LIFLDNQFQMVLVNNNAMVAITIKLRLERTYTFGKL